MRWTGVGLLFCSVSLCTAQTEQFEVASVKPAPQGRSRAGYGGGPGTSDPGRLRYGRISLAGLLSNAYSIEVERIDGAQWLRTDMFTVEAKVPAGATTEQARVMMQNLLRDRFHLEVHMETTNFPAYEIVVARGGPKIKQSTRAGEESTIVEGQRVTVTKDANGFPELPPGRHYQATYSNGTEKASYADISMAEFGRALKFDIGPIIADPWSRTQVVDHTGLTGTFDFTLEFRQKFDDPRSDSPDIFAAMEKQLGLKLQKAGFVPMPVLVVDRADRTPTEN